MSTFLPSVFGENLMDVFHDFGRDLFRGFDRPEDMLYGKNAQRIMKTDVKETDEGYELDVDLPGFSKDEIHLDLENGYLTVSAAREDKQEEKKEGRYIRKERYVGSCQRSFYVGDEVEEGDIKAEFNEGVLKLNIAKKEEKPAVEERKYISIE